MARFLSIIRQGLPLPPPPPPPPPPPSPLIITAKDNVPRCPVSFLLLAAQLGGAWKQGQPIRANVYCHTASLSLLAELLTAASEAWYWTMYVVVGGWL